MHVLGHRFLCFVTSQCAFDCARPRARSNIGLDYFGDFLNPRSWEISFHVLRPCGMILIARAIKYECVLFWCPLESPLLGDQFLCSVSSQCAFDCVRGVKYKFGLVWSPLGSAPLGDQLQCFVTSPYAFDCARAVEYKLD